MTLRELRASLRLWRHRAASRRAHHDAYHRRRGARNDELAAKWHKLEEAARVEARRRERQIARELDEERDARRRHPRERVVVAARGFAGVRETPAGSNRGGRITEWQRSFGDWLVGQPWCGVFAGAMLRDYGGLKSVTGRIAAVSYIEDDARAHRAPFAGWTRNPREVLRGDLVILFGRGVHVEIVERIDLNAGVVYTIGGNTSGSSSGSQSNGGGVFRRARAFSQVHGYARVNYPG